MSSESRFDSGATGASEPHTDPTLRAITGQELPPLWEPRVPELDDRTLARLVAELDGDDEPTRYRRRPPPAAGAVPPPANTPAPPTNASAPPGNTPAPLAGASAPPAAEGAREWPTVPTQQRRQPHAPPTRHRPDRAQHEVSSIGPVIHSPFGDFRPPVQPIRDERGLTGLTRGSRSRLGSLVFTLTFVAIFLVILIETVISLLSAGVGP